MFQQIISRCVSRLTPTFNNVWRIRYLLTVVSVSRGFHKTPIPTVAECRAVMASLESSSASHLHFTPFSFFLFHVLSLFALLFSVVFE